MNAGRVHASVGVYGAFACVALVWREALDGSALHNGHPLGTTHAIAVPLGLSLGALCGVLCVWASRKAMRHTRWGADLHHALRDNIAALPDGSVALLALSAAVGEELLFRGALLPTIAERFGAPEAVALSSLGFGLLHIPWSRALIPWTLSAVAMGVVFAALYLATGEVLAPIAAHAVINHENLHFLRSRND